MSQFQSEELYVVPLTWPAARATLSRRERDFVEDGY